MVGFEYARLDASSEVSEAPSSNPEHDIYRHPLAVGDACESFSRVFDIYALGLILLEIALWRPLRKIVSPVVPELSVPSSSAASSLSAATGMKKKGSGGRSSGSGSNNSSNVSDPGAGTGSGTPPTVPLSRIVKIKEFLLDPTTEQNIPGQLGFLMGERYRDAVLRCLRGDFGGANEDREGGGEDEGVGEDYWDGHGDASSGGGYDSSAMEEMDALAEGALVSEVFWRTVVTGLEAIVV